MLPACDLQADMPQRLQLPKNLCETVRMLQCSSRFVLCSGSRELRSSGSGHVRCSLCAQVLPGSRDLCSSGSGHLRCSLCAQVLPGSRHVRGSGSGHVRCSLCSQVLPGSRDVRGSDLCGSGSGEVLRHRLRDQVLHCRSLRSCTLDL
jgi:hypothetical protein